MPKSKHTKTIKVKMTQNEANVMSLFLRSITEGRTDLHTAFPCMTAEMRVLAERVYTQLKESGYYDA
jgi:hypothetical protein